MGVPCSVTFQAPSHWQQEATDRDVASGGYRAKRCHYRQRNADAFTVQHWQSPRATCTRTWIVAATLPLQPLRRMELYEDPRELAV